MNSNNGIDIEEIEIKDISNPELFVRAIGFQEKRKNWLHLMTHFIAILIISVFLTLVIVQVFIEKNIVNDYFISIVSVIIGFYFAKSPALK